MREGRRTDEDVGHGALVGLLVEVVLDRVALVELIEPALTGAISTEDLYKR